WRREDTARIVDSSVSSFRWSSSSALFVVLGDGSFEFLDIRCCPAMERNSAHRDVDGGLDPSLLKPAHDGRTRYACFNGSLFSRPSFVFWHQASTDADCRILYQAASREPGRASGL